MRALVRLFLGPYHAPYLNNSLAAQDMTSDGGHQEITLVSSSFTGWAREKSRIS